MTDAFSAGNTSKAGGIGYADEQSPTLRAGESGTNMAPTVLAAKTLQVRCGCEGGGKGALVQDDMSAALSTSQAQTVFAPAHAWSIQGNMVGRSDEAGPQGAGVNDEVSFTLNASDRHAVVCLGDDNAKASCDVDMCGALKVGGSSPVAAFAQNTRDEVRYVGGDGSVAGALSADAGAKQQTYVKVAYDVRRLMPVECERLQGFPDGWTDLTGADPELLFERMRRDSMGDVECGRLLRNLRKWCADCPDTPRYKALGNSMAVPVMRWIGERIAATEGAAC